MPGTRKPVNNEIPDFFDRNFGDEIEQLKIEHPKATHAFIFVSILADHYEMRNIDAVRRTRGT